MAAVIEQLRTRIKEVIESLRLKTPVLGGESRILRSHGQIVGGLIGGGKVIDTITKTIDEFITIAKERRPNIIPTVFEKVKTLEPGKRVKEIIPKPAGAAEVAKSVEEKKLLRG